MHEEFFFIIGNPVFRIHRKRSGNHLVADPQADKNIQYFRPRHNNPLWYF